jgi:hypothetical protein
MALLRALKGLPIDVRLPRNVWEPASGMGHMALPLVAHNYNVRCSDILEYGLRLPGTPRPQVLDFLQTQPQWLGKDWAIVTNPPFSLAADFVRHGLRYCPTVMILERLAFLEAKSRADIMNNHLAWVLPFDRRPPMLHRWSRDERTGLWKEWDGVRATSAMPFAWFIFKKWTDGVTRLRRITWTDDDLIDVAPNLIQSGSEMEPTS